MNIIKVHKFENLFDLLKDILTETVQDATDLR